MSMMNINKPAPVTGRYEKDIQELNVCLSRFVDEVLFMRDVFEKQLKDADGRLGTVEEKIEELTSSGT